MKETEKNDNSKKKNSAKPEISSPEPEKASEKSAKSGAKKPAGLHEGHRQRMFDKYSENGLAAFKEHEILEIALYSVFTRINTNEIAHMLLNKFHSILGVFNATVSELCEIPNINKASAIKIKFLGDLMKYAGAQTNTIIRFEKTADFVEYARKIIDREMSEVLLILFLDQNNILVSNSMFKGSSDSVKANINQIIHRVSEINCKKLILIHNHLTDQITPSSSDIRSTRQLRDMLAPLDVEIIDHIILGTKNSYRSFHEDKIIEGI